MGLANQWRAERITKNRPRKPWSRTQMGNLEQTPRMPEDGQEEKSKGLDLPRSLAIAGAATYVAGLLIVNIDLARHGIWDTQLARAQYVEVGALWIFLTLIGAAWLVVSMAIFSMLGAIRWKEFRWRRLHAFIGGTVIMVGFVAFLELMAGSFLFFLPIKMLAPSGRFGSLAFQAFVNASFGWLACLLLFPFIRGYLDAMLRSLGASPIPERFLPDSPQARPYGTVPFACLTISMQLALYASSLYPYLSKTFGGGQATLVRLVLNHAAEAPWGPGIWVSADGRRVGPVALLLEAGSATIVSRPEEFDPYTSLGVAPPAIEVSNSLISLILRVPSARDNEDVLVVGGRNDQSKSLTAGNLFAAGEQRFVSTKEKPANFYQWATEVGR